jgi:hypothetical protein
VDITFEKLVYLLYKIDSMAESCSFTLTVIVLVSILASGIVKVGYWSLSS